MPCPVVLGAGLPHPCSPPGMKVAGNLKVAGSLKAAVCTHV